jgi:hypothetical protein
MIQVNLYYGHIKQYTIDANKHPELQKKDLIELLKSAVDIIDIYCNSPYIINNIILIEAYSRIPDEHRGIYKGISIKNRHFEIKEDGNIVEGEYYKSMISDDNLLNNYIGKTNDEFSDFLELEDKLIKKL